MGNRAENGGFYPGPIDIQRPSFAEHLLPRNARFSPVISLAIIDRSTTKNGLIVPSTKIYTAVRNPNYHLTDPDVISLPTQRVPVEFGQDSLPWYMTTDITETGDEERGRRVEVMWRKRNVYDLHSIKPIRRHVQKLLDTKLGVTQAMKERRLSIHSATIESSILGKVYGTDEDPENGTEMLHMIGLRVDAAFREGTNPFPEETDAYYSAQFMPVEEFTDLVENKNPYLVRRFGDISKVCVRGLCVLAGNKIIKTA